MWYLRAHSSVHTLYVRSAGEWERKCGCVRAGVMNMHNCVWRGVCVCLYIYEVLPQTFNLPQPGECAEERLGGCVLSPPSLRFPPSLCLSAFHLLRKSPTLFFPLNSSSMSSPPPVLLLSHPMLGLILELPPWIPASSWRCPGGGASLTDVLRRALGCSSRACERWAGKGGKVEAHWWKWGQGLVGTEICSLTTRCHGNRSLHNLHLFLLFSPSVTFTL